MRTSHTLARRPVATCYKPDAVAVLTETSSDSPPAQPQVVVVEGYLMTICVWTRFSSRGALRRLRPPRRHEWWWQVKPPPSQ